MRFNTTGPCNPRLHYMLPAAARVPGALDLIDDGLYFVVHAPRQTGKTTTLRALTDSLNNAGGRVALYVSCESAEIAEEDYATTERLLLYRIRKAAASRGYPDEWLPPGHWEEAPGGLQLYGGLGAWASQCPVPIILFFDEIDTLVGKSLVSVLRQLRDGFAERPIGFPASVVLCGMRDVRDYKAASGGDPHRLGGPSPFNIAVESIKMANFSRDDIADLYGRHTTATGQEFTGEAINRTFDYTTGQPWLVNAIAREIIEKISVRPPTPITARHVDEARERLIAARATHLDSLASKLSEPRVRRVIEPLIAGTVLETADTVYDDDKAYVSDLGLIGSSKPIAIANPIYHEVISRLLAQQVIDVVPDSPRSFLLPDGRINLDKLLREFVNFWREQGELMSSGKGYEEAGAQLVLLGYLYRIVNGGGFVDSQYGIGRHRIDILIRKSYTEPDGTSALQREALELKVRRTGETDPIDKGLDQLDSYLSSLGLETGTLVIFDRRHKAPPLEERGIFTDETTANGRKIRLLRL